MPLVAVAALRVLKSRFGPDSSQRVTEFGAAVQQACALLNAELGAAAAVRVIVAPEYYFNAVGMSGGQPTPQPASHGKKRTLYDDLRAISLAANNTVIIAGTLLYRKKKGGVFNKQTQGLNVCPVLLNGNILYEYYKFLDDGCLGRAVPGSIYRHKNTDPFFTHGGVNFGMEICMDHAGHILLDWLGAHPAPPAIDIHILVSDGSGVARSNVAARDGGFIVHCDLSGEVEPSVKVYGFDSTTAPPAQYIGQPDWGRATLIDPVRANSTQLNGVRTEVFRLNV